TDTIVVLNLSDRATVLEVPTEEITPYPDQEIKSISFNNSDDDLFLVVSRKASRVWDLKTGEILASINHEKYEDKIITGKISPDGKWIASGSDSIKDRTRVGPGGSSPVLVNANLRIININNGNVYKKFDHKNHVSFMKFSPDGRYLLSVYNQPTWPTGSGPPKTISFIRVYDTSNWKERFTNEYSQVIKSANFSPDSNLIALSLSDSQTYSRGDKEGWNTAVINTKKGKEIISIDHPNDVIDSIISPDMKSIGIATSGGVFSIYNLSTGEKYGEINHKHSIDSFDISPDSKWVAVGGLD
ncbi:MAG: hypothetical protein GTO02_11115, partial [Candidatus Dadabacteria bacterium]|nr:hypothetical protein [Candidatus Dadabacteria bacterium]